MNGKSRSVAFLVAAVAVGCSPARVPAGPAAPAVPTAQSAPLVARVVAVGIPGASAVAPVGTFHAGGPIHDKPEFAAYTQAGRILEAERILVTSSSNFGSPKARDGELEGSSLSIDPRTSATLVVPSDFARAGGQATTLDGRVQLFTAQSPAFMNQLTTPAAVTADEPSVSNPQGISINNAFGRIWFANVPAGVSGSGTETIIDPDGRPLANAPSDVAGGVFAGSSTNRAQQKVSGSLSTGALGNALLGRSPDGSTKAVFAIVTADGSLLQAHTQQGVDGLAPPGTVHPLAAPGPTRAGVLFNWTPDRILYIAEPAANSVAVVPVTDDGTVFHADAARHLTAAELATPVDLTPAVPEVANPDFSSNTTLAGGSDLYVANSGNGTIVRMRQDGTVVAVRSIHVPGLGELGANRLQGIATSADAGKLWITVSGTLPDHPDAPGGVLEVPAFGGGNSRD